MKNFNLALLVLAALPNYALAESSDCLKFGTGCSTAELAGATLASGAAFGTLVKIRNNANLEYEALAKSSEQHFITNPAKNNFDEALQKMRAVEKGSFSHLLVQLSEAQSKQAYLKFLEEEKVRGLDAFMLRPVDGPYNGPYRGMSAEKFRAEIQKQIDAIKVQPEFQKRQVYLKINENAATKLARADFEKILRGSKVEIVLEGSLAEVSEKLHKSGATILRATNQSLHVNPRSPQLLHKIQKSHRWAGKSLGAGVAIGAATWASSIGAALSSSEAEKSNAPTAEELDSPAAQETAELK